MKKLLLTLLTTFVLILGYSQSDSIVYRINYISTTDVKNPINNLNEYHMFNGNNYMLFSSVEESMGNLRGYHKRPLVDRGKENLVFILNDYCCGDNGNEPSKIILTKDNKIKTTK